VTVRGEAQLDGPPDLATLTLTLHASGDSSERTRSKLAEGSNAVSQLLQRFEAAIERSSTSGLHVSPVFNRRAPGQLDSPDVLVADGSAEGRNNLAWADHKQIESLFLDGEKPSSR